ncbi:MAG: DUF533 domain-containing protein [Pirellulales bacterium]
MIIYGTRGITSTLSSHQFHCPRCSSPRSGLLKQVRTFFTLYFIPIIPLNVRGRYIECDSCNGTFGEEILDYNPAQEVEKTNTQLLRIMVMSALADGVVDANERAEIEKQYMQIAGLPVTQSVLDDEIRMASASGADLNSYVANIAPGFSAHGKGLIVRLAFLTMSASPELTAGHKLQLSNLATTLQIPAEQYKELIRHISETASEE